MKFEQSMDISSREKGSEATVEVESGYEQFAPREFCDDPIGYFERKGQNIKSGEVKYDEEGRVREDPTAVKDLPPWRDEEGNVLDVVAKRVNVEKAEIGKSGDPFYEYNILERLRKLGLPAANPIAKVKSGETHLVVMEKVPGIRWSEKDALHLRERGYSDDDIEDLKRQAESQMAELQRRFDEAGIGRSWKLKDMVFDIDVENKQVRSLTPTDWERTRLTDPEEIRAYRKESE